MSANWPLGDYTADTFAESGLEDQIIEDEWGEDVGATLNAVLADLAAAIVATDAGYESVAAAAGVWAQRNAVVFQGLGSPVVEIDAIPTGTDTLAFKVWCENGYERRAIFVIENNVTSVGSKLVDVNLRNCVVNVGDASATESFEGTKIRFLQPVGATGNLIEVLVAGSQTSKLFRVTNAGAVMVNSRGVGSRAFAINSAANDDAGYEPWFAINESGQQGWGPGGSGSALDVTLGRASSGVLEVGGKIRQTGTTSSSTDLATKAYVDSVSAGASPSDVVIYVRTAAEGGNDTNSGKTPSAPKLTLASAVAALPTFGSGGQASKGGTIDIGAGTFDFSATLPDLYRNFEIRGRGCAGAQGSTGFDNAGTTLRRMANVALIDTVPAGGSFTDWAHHVLIRDLHVDGNRDAYPGMTPIFRIEKPGFGTRFENVTSKNCPGPFVHAIQPVNWHSIGLNATNSGSVRCGLSVNTGTDTITLAGHGLIDDDVAQFVNTTSTGLTEGVWYYVVGGTTDTFQVSATKGGSAVDLTGGDPVLLRPGGVVLEFNVSGGHATVRDVQADDNVIAPFSVIASGTSRNNKVWLEGKFENKDATRQENVSVALTTGVCTKSAHGYSTGDVVTTYDHSASWSALLPGVFYWVKRLTSSTFELYRDPALADQVTALAGSGTGTIDTQKGGGGVYCHRNIVDVDQSDQTNGMTIQLGLVSAQLDGVLNSDPLWSAYGDHAIVRLSAVTASGTAPLTAVFGIGVTSGGGTGGHYDVLVNDVDNSVTFGDPGLEASTFWYKGTASATATPTLVEYVQGTERFICTAVPTRSSPDGSFAINKTTGKGYLRQSGVWREIAVV
jgi:hypothetical protein